MTWISSSCDALHPSPTSRSPSTLPTQQSNLQIVPISAKGCRQQGHAQLNRRWRSMSMIWWRTRILHPPLMQLRKQQDNNRLESCSGVSYTDCTHSSSRMRASFPECGHGVDSTPEFANFNPNLHDGKSPLFRVFRPIKGLLNQTFWSFSLQVSKSLMGLLTGRDRRL